ncbi:MAG: hypothetical protein EZS28_010108, partial [Streblomastix strix]
DIQGTVGQLTGLQPSSGAQSLSLNAGLRLKETGTISVSNRERTDPQKNEGQKDNAEEEEDEQTDETALIQNNDNRVNVIQQLPVQENLRAQPLNDQGLNAMSQMDKDNTSPAPIGIQEKPKKGKGCNKTKIEGQIVSNKKSQGSNAQTQTQTASTVPKPNAAPKMKPLIGQRYSNQGRSVLRSPSGTERRSVLMRMAPQETEERIGGLIYNEKKNEMGGKSKRFIETWKQIKKEDFINTGFHPRFKDQNRQQGLEENKMIIPFRGTQEEKEAYQEMLKEELEE